jgi:hypothetical protein
MGGGLAKDSRNEKRQQQKQITTWLAHASKDLDIFADDEETVPPYIKAMSNILLPKTLTFVDKHLRQKLLQCSEILENESRLAFISHKWDGNNPDPGDLVKQEIQKGEYDLYWVDYLYKLAFQPHWQTS